MKPIFFLGLVLANSCVLYAFPPYPWSDDLGTCRIGGARDDGSTTIPNASAKLLGWGENPTAAVALAFVLSFRVVSTDNIDVVSSPRVLMGGARDDGSTTMPRASAKLPDWGLKPIVFEEPLIVPCLVDELLSCV